MTERPLPHRPRQPSLRRSALAVEAGFRLPARLRGAPALHPRGLTCAAELEVVPDGGEPWGAPWLDTTGRYAATVRLSRAAGLPRRLPDGLGLAVRVARADGPDRPLAAAAVPPVLAYLSAARRLRRRGDAWPRRRDASFASGGVGVGWAAAGWLPGRPFTGHMVQHLVVGVLAPLLLVLARPLTLALRTLGPGPTRRGLLALVHSRPARWPVSPLWAALLDVGGLWLLYRAVLFAAASHRPLAHGVVHAHVLAAGFLFTFAVCRLDPVRRRWSVTSRGAVLLAAGAAHALLAKTRYAVPPAGTDFTAAALRTGAQWMYYGGDIAEAALAVALGLGRYRARGRTRAPAGRVPTCAC